MKVGARFAQIVKARRAELEMSQLRYSERMGVSSSALERWEQQLSDPGLAMVELVCSDASAPIEVGEGRPAPATTFEQLVRVLVERHHLGRYRPTVMMWHRRGTVPKLSTLDRVLRYVGMSYTIGEEI